MSTARAAKKSMDLAQGGRDIPTGVKDPGLVRQRRRQIVDAAAQLFIHKGFHKTTTRELAKASGLAIGTLYEYVKSKEDVLYLVCEAIHHQVESRIKDRLADHSQGDQALRAAIGAYFRVCDEMNDHILLIYQETKSLPKESMGFVLKNEERITSIFAAIINQGVGDYTLKPLDESQIRLMANNIAVLGHMWTFRRWYLRREYTLDEYIEHQTALIMGQLV